MSKQDKPIGRTMGDRATGTVVPERRSAEVKEHRGDGGVPGRVGVDNVTPSNWSLAPDPQEGFVWPGRGRQSP